MWNSVWCFKRSCEKQQNIKDQGCKAILLDPNCETCSNFLPAQKWGGSNVKKMVLFFLHRFCVRDLSGIFACCFLHVFARIIWLVLKVNQHVFHVGLCQFDNFWQDFTMFHYQKQVNYTSKNTKNTEFCCDLSRSVGICRDLSGFVGLLHSWTCPRQIPANPDRSRQIPTDRDKSQQNSVVFCVFARVVHLLLIVKHGEILSKVVKLTQTNMENMLIHLKNKPNYTSKNVKKQHAKIPDKSRQIPYTKPV